VVRDFAADNTLGCHAGQLNQVLMNVIANAVDAIAGKGTLTLKTESDVGGMFVITVKDDGCGIPQEHMDRIFDPFFTTKPVGQGTGLGLAISYNIVQAHKGRIDIDSRPGQGTTLRLLIPRTLAG
jgi:two-component system NtrC family sensor kinase